MTIQTSVAGTFNLSQYASLEVALLSNNMLLSFGSNVGYTLRQITFMRNS